MLGKYTAYDILIDFDAKHGGNKLRNAGTAITGITLL